MEVSDLIPARRHLEKPEGFDKGLVRDGGFGMLHLEDRMVKYYFLCQVSEAWLRLLICEDVRAVGFINAFRQVRAIW